VVAPVAEEDGVEVEDSNNPTAAEEVATRAVNKVATAASRAATTKTSSKVEVNGERRSNPSYEFSLTSLETQNPDGRADMSMGSWRSTD
jgi:hypothetical protein